MAEVIIVVALLVVFWSTLRILKNTINNTVEKGSSIWDMQLDAWSTEQKHALNKRIKELSND